MVALMRKQTLSWILFALLAIAGCAEHDDSKGISNPERILTRGIGGDPETLDPGLAEDVHAFSVLIDTFEGLISENAAGELIPGVAERWDVSDDAKVYTFYLRDDARWSNGDPVVALDFVRAIRRVLDPETLSPYGSLLDGVEDLEASSERVLQIRLKSPASHFLALLALPVASPQHESLDASIGNGAYVLVDRIPGSRIQVRKNKHYRDADAVYYDIVNYLPVVDPDAEFNMFRAGELDVTHNIPDAQIAGMLRDNLAEAHISASLSLYYLAFDMTGPPLDDPALRQALSMAIDRQAIVEMLGRGDRAAYGVVPPGISRYDGAQYSWHTQPAEERQATARNLFAAAGYDESLEITFMYDAGGVHEKIALAVTAMWNEVLGFDAAIEKREWKYFLDTRELREDWDVMRFAWVGDYNAPNTFLDIFRSGDEQNLAVYSSADFDKLMAEAAQQQDPQIAASLHASAENVMLNDYPIAPLYFFASKHLVETSIGGFHDNIVDRHASRFLFRKVP
jgi:ABC-type oligopeptide transport system substrate-binding subunit